MNFFINSVVREKYEELMGKDERFASYKVLNLQSHLNIQFRIR